MENTTVVGIHKLELYIPDSYLTLNSLAEHHDIAPGKYILGIGQSKMAVPSPDEDVITLAANAAQSVLDSLTSKEAQSISTLIFATESSVDQSKSGAAYLMGLIDIQSNCRAFEIKQACYAGTAGLQMACDLAKARPEESILLVASDIARYKQNSPGECTQGAGAIAMLISANPDIVEIDPERGFYSTDIMDFWRPNDFKHALVDGELSKDAYLNIMNKSYLNYIHKGGKSLSEFDWLCFHQPFTKMANKAYRHLKESFVDEMKDKTEASYAITQTYGRVIGNTYTASLYIGLLSLLDNAEQDVSGQKIGFFSYGSGAVGEFFSGTINQNYRLGINTKHNKQRLSERHEINYDTYIEYMYQTRDVGQLENIKSQSKFRFIGITDHKRVYQRCPMLKRKAA